VNTIGKQVVKFVFIRIHKLERLASDSEDTWEHDLPILYVDWHTENDTIGSVTQFEKY